MAFAPPRKKEVDAAFDSVDTNNDGVIDRREFMACQKLHSMQNLIAPKVKFQSKNLYLIDLHVSAEQLLRPAFLSGEKEFLIEPPCRKRYSKHRIHCGAAERFSTLPQ